MLAGIFCAFAFMLAMLSPSCLHACNACNACRFPCALAITLATPSLAMLSCFRLQRHHACDAYRHFLCSCLHAFMPSVPRRFSLPRICEAPYPATQGFPSKACICLTTYRTEVFTQAYFSMRNLNTKVSSG